ncbi:MAG: hypothetical protein ABI843_02345 [Dokdonella sp.]
MLQNWKSAISRGVAQLDRLWSMTLWALLSIVVLIVVVTFLNPAKFGGYLWVVSKLSLAAVLGYGFDRAAARNDSPEVLEGLERAMAQTRRATLMAAAIIAAGLMP